jgi:2-dehydro-3-deoxyphosphogluconate aldolase/(4S)-4-hydroxy-2-oxoglutarate aldolase
MSTAPVTAIETLLDGIPVIPVLELTDVDTAPALADALISGGLPALEITLRTSQALDAIAAIKSACPAAIVGAGTVNTPAQLEQCHKAGVDFMVSPGLHKPLLDAARDSGIPYLPGVASASEVLLAINEDLRACKFFPAQQAGGIAMLKAFGGPYAEMRFCPTGGISADNFRDFLALDNVFCVGGSWTAPASLVQQQAWSEITDRAKFCSS